MDLRFKHFGTFVVVVGLLAAAFQMQSLSAIRTSVAGIAIVLTVLFWLLDYRTSQNHRDEVERIHAFQKEW